MQTENTSEKLRAEIEERLAEMEREDCRFPRRFTRRDYAVAAAVVVICLLFLLAGARL